MSAAEPYDYIATASPDSTSTLAISPIGVFRELGQMNQVVHLADDLSEEIVALSTAKQFYFEIPWNALSESDAGTIFDFYCNTTIGNGKMRTFKYTHEYGATTHTYVVRFDCDLAREIREGNIHSANVRLKVKGKISDA